jgi:hypothetical protein
MPGALQEDLTALAGKLIAGEQPGLMTAQRLKRMPGAIHDIAMALYAVQIPGGQLAVIKSTDDVITLIVLGMAIAAIIFDLYS